MRLYHVTDPDYVESIRRNGLTAKPTQASDPGHTDSGVWCFASFDALAEGQSVSHVHRFGTDNYNQEYAVVVIDAGGCELIPDPEYPEGVAVICLQDIEPERIVEVRIVDLYAE